MTFEVGLVETLSQAFGMGSVGRGGSVGTAKLVTGLRLTRTGPASLSY
jgi:hypothetical protein